MPINYGENMEFPIDTKVIPLISDKLVDQWIEDTIYSKSATNRLSWLFQKFKSDS